MQHDATHSYPTKFRHRVTPYFAIWGSLAAVAIIYIGVAIAKPDLFGVTDTNLHDFSVVDAERDAARLAAAETDALRRELSYTQKELARAEAENAKRLANEEAYLERIAALETQTQQGAVPETAEPQSGGDENTSKEPDEKAGDQPKTAKLLNGGDADETTTTLVKNAAEPEKTKPSKTANKKDTPKVEKPKVTKTEPKAEAAPKKVAAAAKPAAKPATKPKAKVETGSLGSANSNKPIDFGPAVVNRATKPIGVRIATGPSVDSLRLSWSALSDRHGPTLSSLTPRYVTGIDATGLTYDLIAGPFNTREDATQVCARLHANGVRCALGEFTGNAL